MLSSGSVAVSMAIGIASVAWSVLILWQPVRPSVLGIIMSFRIEMRFRLRAHIHCILAVAHLKDNMAIGRQLFTNNRACASSSAIKPFFYVFSSLDWFVSMGFLVLLKANSCFYRHYVGRRYPEECSYHKRIKLGVSAAPDFVQRFLCRHCGAIGTVRGHGIEGISHR